MWVAQYTDCGRSEREEGRGSGGKVARDYNGKYVRNEVKGVGSREPRRSLGE